MNVSSFPFRPPMLGVTPAARLYYRYLVLFVNGKLPARANISRGPLLRSLQLDSRRSTIDFSQDRPRRDPVDFDQYPQYKVHCTPQKKWGTLLPPDRHTLSPIERPDACQGTWRGRGDGSTSRTSEPLLRRLPTKWDETELNRLQVWPGQLLHTAVAPRLVPDGKRGRCRYYPPPSRSHHPTEVSDDSPPLGQLDEAGSPSPSVFVLPVPGSLEFRRSPLSALVRSLSYVNHAARTCRKRPYGQKC